MRKWRRPSSSLPLATILRRPIASTRTMTMTLTLCVSCRVQSCRPRNTAVCWSLNIDVRSVPTSSRKERARRNVALPSGRAGHVRAAETDVDARETDADLDREAIREADTGGTPHELGIDGHAAEAVAGPGAVLVAHCVENIPAHLCVAIEAEAGTEVRRGIRVAGPRPARSRAVRRNVRPSLEAGQSLRLLSRVIGHQDPQVDLHPGKAPVIHRLQFAPA